jgi:uncharacterized membrane protein YhfC
MNNVTLSIIPAAGMMIVASLAVIIWRRVSGLQFRWFLIGAALWTVAVIMKVVCALLTNKAAFGYMKEHLSHPLYVLGGGLLLGIQSSLFEIGLTLAAVLIWKRFGRDANRAIGIGVGAGAVEALLLGIMSLAGILTFLAGLPGTEVVREKIDAVARVTPLFILIAPVERILTIPCHASSRALVLLGVTHRKPVMIFWGFLLFTLLDGVAGLFLISGKTSQISTWWVELAALPFAVASIPILRWCYFRWSKNEDESMESLKSTKSDAPAYKDELRC